MPSMQDEHMGKVSEPSNKYVSQSRRVDLRVKNIKVCMIPGVTAGVQNRLQYCAMASLLTRMSYPADNILLFPYCSQYLIEKNHL